MNTLFPRRCLHCKCESAPYLLCTMCVELLALCARKSQRGAPPFCAVAATLDGPLCSSFVFQLRGSDALMRGVAALMVLQWSRLHWSTPDWVVGAGVDSQVERALARAVRRLLGLPAWRRPRCVRTLLVVQVRLRAELAESAVASTVEEAYALAVAR